MEPTEQLTIVSVSFHAAGKIFDFDSNQHTLLPGDPVIVETERGRALGTVVAAPREIPAEQAPAKLKSIVRPASSADLDMAAGNARREQEALHYCQQRARQRRMEMKLVRAEYLFDGSKIIFYFTADGRVDFRELVRDLAQHFRTRIEMRQIGVRDEAKLVGGLGICGRELCCCSHLRDFAPVSVKMAKAQGLALNPSKISGQCGRLLCCLAYEYENYHSLKKNLPKCGKKLQIQEGTAEVVALDILAQKVTLACPGGERCQLHIEELQKKLSGAGEAPSREQPAPRERRAAAAPEEPRATATDKPAAKKKSADPDKPARKRRRPRRRSNRSKNPRKPTES